MQSSLRNLENHLRGRLGVSWAEVLVVFDVDHRHRVCLQKGVMI